MGNQGFEKAFADWPQTVLTRDGGAHLTGKYVYPTLESRADAVLGLSSLAFAVWASFRTENVATGVLIMLVVSTCWYLFLRRLIFRTFGKNVDVKIYPGRIAVRQWFGYRNYSREMPLEFRIEQHRKAIAEEANEVRLQKRLRRTYRDAVEVVMQYGEKRVSLAELRYKDIEMAQALVLRLQNVCASLDAAMEMVAQGRIRPAGRGAEDFGPAPEIR